MGNTHYISPEGLEKLQEELAVLKTVKRREATERIETAKALGDLSENAEYHEAKETLALIEGRIYEIEETLKDISLIQHGNGIADTVRIGCTVTVRVLGKERKLTIVGSNEANPSQGKISNESPIGAALLGAHLGDQVAVQAPMGSQTYAIVAIEQ